MSPDSFTYNGTDMYEQFRLRVVIYDLLIPQLRERKLTVPGRSGVFDYGARYHEERVLRMVAEIDGPITDAQFDSLKYTLSRKGKRIVLWDKPDRYFIGRLYDPTEVIDFYRHAKREFELNFVCDPYAYALEPTIIKSTQAITPIRYEGTWETPTRITVRNTGNTPLRALSLTAREVN